MDEMNTAWHCANGQESIEVGQIHVWRADLALWASRALHLEGVLSADERERALRYVHSDDRQRFIAARAILRQVLARYVIGGPEQLEFSYGEHGKPILAGDAASTGIEFNMSHSGEMALYAVVRGASVGVDIEYPRPRTKYMRIAERFFSIEEFEALNALPADMRPVAFYRCWTRKEAYVKARGDGIAAGLDTFSVSLEKRAQLLRSDAGPEEIKRWHLMTLQPGGDYVAAVCASGQMPDLSCFEWSF